MTVQERKERARIKRRKQIIKRRIVLLLTAIFVVTIGSVVCGSIFSSAKNPASDIPQYKYYKTITVNSGDSLWSIAEEYATCSDIREYVSELKEINNLTSKDIYAGQKIMVSYYDTELK